jgi:quinol monooxygenase YgiN
VLAVTVRFTVKPGREDAFLARVLRQAADTLQHEPECRQFDVCRASGDPRRVFLYEIYTDDMAFTAHLGTAHFLAFDRQTRDWIDEKVAERWMRCETP